MSLDLAQPSSLPLNPCLEVGLGTRERRTELGWPEELVLVSSWTTSPCPHPDSQSLKRLAFPRMGVSRRGASGCPAHCQGSLRAGCLISLENGSAALIMNSIIEYIAFVLFFYRKVTFCNHVMYIKLFIKVNILHNKPFLNTLCMTSCAVCPFLGCLEDLGRNKFAYPLRGDWI